LQGILPAIANVFPCAEHRYCLRHINENLKQSFRGTIYKEHLWKLATTSTLIQFDKAMQDLKNFNSEAHDWISKIPPEHWSRSHFSGQLFIQSVVLENIVTLN
jgi:hypothetical protein